MAEDEQSKQALKSKPKRVVLPYLSLIEPCDAGDPKSFAIDMPSNQGTRYYAKLHTDFLLSSYPHFPVVLDADGSPWAHANLYLVHKLESVRVPKPKTLDSIACDLATFKAFVDSNGIDYMQSSKRKLMRPTYRYRAELTSLIEDGAISASTASRRISSVVGFYRWLERQHDAQFEFPLWQETDFQISFVDSKGLRQNKHAVTTDLAVRIPRSRNDYSEYIEDGGRLRPLDKGEQETLIRSLMGIGNIEMTLAFFIALTTGARIQTVFTLRVKHAISRVRSGEMTVDVLVGGVTGVDTKAQKQYVISIPTWLHSRLRTYVLSERSERRRAKSIHQFPSPGDQYLFLTKSGVPYYVAYDDPCALQYRHPPRGSAVRQFICDQLMPQIVKMQKGVAFSFHDLRATFGVNLLEERVKLIESGKVTLYDALMYVMQRMGHSQLSTTERYLQYRKKFELAINVQSDFEGYLQSLLSAEDYDA